MRSVSVVMFFDISGFQIVLFRISPPWTWNSVMFVCFFHDYWNLKSNRHFSFNMSFRLNISSICWSSTSDFNFSFFTVFEWWWKTSTSVIRSIFNQCSIALWNTKSSQYRSFNLSSIIQILFRFFFVIARACHEMLLSLYLNHSSCGVLKTGLTILFFKCSWIILSKFFESSTSSLITNTFSFFDISNALFRSHVIFLSVCWMKICIVQSSGFHESINSCNFVISCFHGLSNSTKNSILSALFSKTLLIVLSVRSVRL